MNLGQAACSYLFHTEPRTVTSLSVSQSFTLGLRRGAETRNTWVFKCLDLEREGTGNGCVRSIEGRVPVGTDVVEMGTEVPRKTKIRATV